MLKIVLCKPALVYLTISTIALIIIIFQNIGSQNKYCLGSTSCTTPHLMAIFVMKIFYILFWTWILNLICKGGSTFIAWILVLVPLILQFIFLLFFLPLRISYFV